MHVRHLPVADIRHRSFRRQVAVMCDLDRVTSNVEALGAPGQIDQRFRQPSI